MASRDGNEGEQELHDGHRIAYSEWLTNLNSRLPLNLDWPFTLDCSVSPTSWLFRATFHREPNSDDVSCSISFKRTDKIKIRVDVEFKLSVFPPLEYVSIRSKEIREPRMSRKLRVVAIVDGFIPNKVLRLLGDRHYLFEVTCTVRGCHEERDTLRTVGDPPVVDGSKDQMLCSKL